MNKEDIQQLVLRTIMIGNETNITPVNQAEVIHLICREYQLPKHTVETAIHSLDYEGLIGVNKKGEITYKGYNESYPVCGE